MKELSIEEKRYDGNYKAYTELINRLEDVKNAIKKQNYGIAMDILCKPCPEFQITAHSDIKESEDEKIRKSLAAYFAKFKPDDMWDADFSFGDIVSWFEKQGEKVKLIEGFDTEFERQVSYLIASAMNKDYEYTKDFVKWTSDGLLNYAKHKLEKNSMGISEATKKKLEDNLNKALEKETPESCNKFLDEQAEQKSADKIQLGKKYKCIASPKYTLFMIGEIYKPEDKFLCSLMNLCYDCFEPIEDGEQNPADKIEPKFKIKDYIISNNNSESIYHITGTGINELGNPCYVCEYVGREKEYNNKIYNMRQDKVDVNFKLWTIQDAKDGDVIFTSSTASHETFIFKNIDENGNVECYFAYDSEDGFREGKYHFIGRATNSKPATKEQYDDLIKAMADAGYEWDSEKKELKKIEQKPVVILKFRIGDTIKNKKTNKIFTISDYSLLYEYYHDINHYHEIKFSEQDDWELVEQNPAWSEEDGKYMSAIIKMVEHCSFSSIGGITKAAAIDWLKSLKDKAQSQYLTITDEELVQAEKEWSKDDITRINEIIETLNIVQANRVRTQRMHYSKATIDKNIDWLKSLKERCTWKPSKKQIIALRWVLNNVPYCTHKEEVSELLDQIKNL